MMPEEVSKLAQEQKEKIRRLTNQQLWTGLLTMGTMGVGDFKIEAVERELERRLRKVAFLPALPPKEEA
jgi:hypothetical protein